MRSHRRSYLGYTKYKTSRYKAYILVSTPRQTKAAKEDPNCIFLHHNVTKRSVGSNWLILYRNGPKANERVNLKFLTRIWQLTRRVRQDTFREQVHEIYHIFTHSIPFPFLALARCLLHSSSNFVCCRPPYSRDDRPQEPRKDSIGHVFFHVPGWYILPASDL